jgi:peptidyl-tRNA hydrolase
MKEHFHSSEKKYNQPPTESARGGNHFLIILGMKDTFVNFSGLLMGNIIYYYNPDLYRICVFDEVYLTQRGS